MSVNRDIFKVQLPLGRFRHAFGEPNLVRIHNEHRTIAFTLPVTRELIKLFKKGQDRVHVNGQWDDSTGDINLGPVIADQGW